MLFSSPRASLGGLHFLFPTAGVLRAVRSVDLAKESMWVKPSVELTASTRAGFL